MVEAGGVGINTAVENTDVIDFSRLQKRRTRQNCAQLETYLERELFHFCPEMKSGCGAIPGEDRNAQISPLASVWNASWVRGTGSDYGRLAGSTRNWRFPSIRYVAKSA
jgi:hypothetical protein